MCLHPCHYPSPFGLRVDGSYLSYLIASPEMLWYDISHLQVNFDAVSIASVFPYPTPARFTYFLRNLIHALRYHLSHSGSPEHTDLVVLSVTVLIMIYFVGIQYLLSDVALGDEELQKAIAGDFRDGWHR